MSNEEARQIVEGGLEQRRIQRQKRAEELEDQARLLRITINDNHLVKAINEERNKQLKIEEDRKRREARARERAESVIRDQKASDACNSYLMACLLIMLVSAVTRLNFFVALALILGLAVFPAAYIFRLYYPIKEVK